MEDIIFFDSPYDEYGFLSNFYKSDFTVNGLRFTSMEQYLMYSKAVMFSDIDIAGRVMDTDDIEKIKSLGKKIQRYMKEVWQIRRQDIVFKGLIAKFSQNSELKSKLLETDEAMLAKCTGKTWGIGLPMSSEAKEDRNLWIGQNILGYSLMQVRDYIRCEQ